MNVNVFAFHKKIFFELKIFDFNFSVFSSANINMTRNEETGYRYHRIFFSEGEMVDRKDKWFVVFSL